MLFVEAPHDEAEMAAICRDAPGRHLANMLSGGDTPLTAPARLAELGFTLVAYPLTLLSASIAAMHRALADLSAGRDPHGAAVDFAELRRIVGFDAYDSEAARYAVPEA